MRLVRLIGPIGLIAIIGIIFPLAVQAVEIVDGDLVRTQGDVDVYIVKLINNKKFKRLILNPAVFNQYDHLKWEDIKDVSENIVNQYTTSELVRAVDDKKVYKLYPSGDSGEKRWIKTANDFLDLGYDWDAIYNINSFERDFYIPGDDLESTKAPDQPEPDDDEPIVLDRDPKTINVPDDYSTIQAAIDAAIDGDTISVESGTYRESLTIDKNIKLIGSYAASAVIDGQGDEPAITVQGADDFLIQRFTIMSSDNKAIYCSGASLSKGSIKNTIIKNSGSGIYVDGKCNLTILNNLIFDNKDSSKETGFGIYINNSELYDFTTEVRNNSIVGNYHGVWVENANLKTMNNIITDNVGLGISTGIYHIGEGNVANTYNNVWQNGWNYRENAKAGSGSLVVNPLFVQPIQENYKLKTGSTEYSPCLDAGNPEYIYNDGTYSSNTVRNDMGAYGGPDNIGWNP